MTQAYPLTLIRVTALSLLLGSALSACVWPGEFDEINPTCPEEEGRFDVPTRSSYCSGQVQQDLVYRAEDLDRQEGATSLIDIQGPYITWLEKSPQGPQATVRLLRSEDGVQYELLDQLQIELPSQQAVAFAATGLEQDQQRLDGVTLTVSSPQDLYFVRVSSLDAPDFPVGGPLAPVDYLTEEARQEFSQMQAALPEQDRCYTNRVSGQRYALSDMVAFTSSKDQQRRYLMLSAGCALSIFGYDPDAAGFQEEPALMVQYPLQARDIDLDLEQDRFYLASGTDGLLVRTLSTLERNLDQIMDNLEFGVEAGGNNGVSDPGANNSDGGGNNDNGAPDRGAFTPGVEDFPGSLDDAALLATTHVTHVTFARDRRVFFLNTPRPEALQDPAQMQAPDLTAYLVSVTLDQDGLIQERHSVPLATPDPQTGQVYDFDWKVVGLGDAQVAVLAKRLDEDGEVENSALVLYDAPKGQAPVAVKAISTGTRIDDIELRDGELWVTQPDTIVRYRVSIGGAALP